MKTFLKVSGCLLIVIVFIFISYTIGVLKGRVLGIVEMKSYVLDRCLAQSSKWYPYPELCKYYVGDIKGRDE